MDNFSHAVASLAASECIHRSLPAEQDAQRHVTRHRMLLIAGALAGNFPDLDLVLTSLLPEPLGYLLHHRGHTHTLLYALPQAALLWALLWVCWPAARRLMRESRTARWGLALTIAAGFLLHLLMDYLNSYGVHPFHPFDSRWYFGDLVFILEPVFWVTFGVPLAMMMPWRPLRFLGVATLVGVPLYFTTKEFLPWVSFAVLAAIALTLALAQRRSGAQGRSALALAFAIATGFVVMQGVASREGKRVLAETIRQQDPSTRVLDASMSSFPSNPFCWVFVTVDANESEDRYTLRRGLVSPLPDWMPVSACPASLARDVIGAAPTPAIGVVQEKQFSLSELRERRQTDCHFEAWMRFARAPWVTDTEATDVRFASSPRGNFTTMRFEELRDEACSRYVPQWDFPRRDLLMPSTGKVE